MLRKQAVQNDVLTRGRGMSQRVTVASVVAVLAAVAIAAAAGVGGGTGKAAPQGSQVSGTITLAHWSSSTVETQLLRQVLAGFRKSHPKIKVNELVLDPYPQQMLTRFAARKSPDVFYVDSNVIPDW